MQIVITDEAHNRVDWIVRPPLLRILLGMLVGWAIFVALVVTSPSSLRWSLTGIVSAVVCVMILILAFTTPVREKGHLERTIEGGDVQRIKRWLFLGKRVAWEIPLANVSGFQMEWRKFEESADYLYTLARLWVVLTDDSLVLLTDWAEPQAVQTLGASLARSGRRVFEE